MCGPWNISKNKRKALKYKIGHKRSERQKDWLRVKHFVELKKAFNGVHRRSLWKIIRHYGVPQKVTYIISLFYSDFISFTHNTTLRFVKQGCVMSPFMCIMIMDYLMRNVTEQIRTGIR